MIHRFRGAVLCLTASCVFGLCADHVKAQDSEGRRR